MHLLFLLTLPLQAQGPANFIPPPNNAAPASPAIACKSLIAQTTYEFTIESAILTPADAETPEFCRVMGMILPEIRFELALPTQWNRRFHLTGSGGYAGDSLDSPQRLRLRTIALRRGFAAAVTNTGHDSRTEPLATFATNRQKLYDYAYRSLHLTTEVGKKLTAVYYGSQPVKSYYQGCSTGGRQGLILAQRFPNDYDGIVAGAPVLNFSMTMAGFACREQALLEAPIPYAKIATLSDRIYENCDAIDGLKDGVIDDPRLCTFQPARDLPRCPANQDTSSCFTESQVKALEKIYADIYSNGKRVFPGWPLGAEVKGADGKSGWDQWIIRENGEKTIAWGFAESFFRHMAFPRKEQSIELRDFDPNKHIPQLDWIHPILDATDPDLTPFQKRNGKMLMYFGWADPSLNAMMGVEYYESVLKITGPRTPDFFRLFMQPGIFHCGGGPGAGTFDPLLEVMAWVEQNKTPDRITAARIIDGKTTRTRPLCPYPQIAKYKGAGNPDDAANFECAVARASRPARN
ncbi:MAG: tannase/feruloyl esterase family alpha/beta hydrolase [Acidobacteria bacterium]|nr:tannase/feruloyl esterase family alpha/beta hydrolase [Acidobacteriota bacterium]